jgi:two-component system sensor histidine kinase BaeS
VARISLRRKLPAAVAGVALLTMVVLGAILIPLVEGHYSRSEASYLRAAAEQAADGLSSVDWRAVAEARDAADSGSSAGSVSSTEGAMALRRAQLVALSMQVRVRVYDNAGELLVDSGLPGEIDVVGLTEGVRPDDGGRGDSGIGHGATGRMADRGIHGLPSPLGDGLFGEAQVETGSRSDRTVEAPLTTGGAVVATILLSEGPDYGAAVVRTTLTAWLIAGSAALVLAALAGWLYSRRLARPLLAIASASNAVAAGDLSTRADVARADEIGAVADSFNAMADKNQATVAALRRFVADAAHEIGTPLTALQADLELAKDSPDEPARQRMIERATVQADRIQRLAKALLQLSLLDTGTPRRFERLDLVPLVISVVGSFASRAEQAGVDLVVNVTAGELPVSGDEAGLRTAVDNLVDNALKFTPEGGSVELGAAAEGRQAVIWTRDTGIGIPEEDVAALFSRFHRGRNASAYPGSGLGLAIVRATMELHGGTASVTSSAAGSRFELRLPLA